MPASAMNRWASSGRGHDSARRELHRDGFSRAYLWQADHRRGSLHLHAATRNGKVIPATSKTLATGHSAKGINRFVFHRFAAQPWTKAAPGMSMGAYGLHYERTQTWWEQSKAWHEYLARCQSLLQQGQFVADIAYLAPEGAA